LARVPRTDDMAESSEETNMPDDASTPREPRPTLAGGDSRDRSGVAGGSAATAARASVRTDWPIVALKVASLAIALFLFVLAIQLMKEGAKAIGPSLSDSPLFSNAFSTLGAGWLGAYVVLSGSPIAAVALSLYNGGGTSELQTFTMVSGSRLGASFVVLVAGFLYAIRNSHHDRGEAIGMGVLALSLSAILYVPGTVIGYGILKSDILEDVRWHASGEFRSIVDIVWGPALDAARQLPGWTLLPIGLAIVLVAFRFLDRVLPKLDGERHGNPRIERLKRPWPMFLIGCIVATLTLSVSVALTLLVPLASHGLLKRREAIPYIMGANITTLADTLVAAMVLGSAVGVQIVLAQAIAVSVVALLLLGLAYRPLVDAVMRLDEWVVASNRRLSLFVLVLFVLPAIFLTSGIWIGPITN
jgi:solute carrier family 34 (sodium-dependent phosphate cotransporter)